MKSLALLAAAGFLLASGTLSRAASIHTQPSVRVAGHNWLIAVHAPSLGRIGIHTAVLPASVPFQAASGTATATPEPSPTPTTGSTFPDPQTILNNMFNVVGLVKYAHFEELADQTGAVNLHVDAVGDATCTGPAIIANVVASATVAGTTQSSKSSFHLIQVKNSLFRKTKATKNKWQPATAKQVEPFGFVVSNPLPCPTASSPGGTTGGSGQPTDTIKDLQNTGPTTVNGHQDWKITATDVQLDPTTNTTSELPLEWDIEQAHPLLDQFVISFDDPANQVKGSLTTKLTKFGKKVVIKKPKKGANKP